MRLEDGGTRVTGDDLRALSAAATTGPWRPWGEPGSYVHIWTADERMVARDALTQDAELIVWLRNHADALADLIDAARAVRTGPVDCVNVAGSELLDALADALAALDGDR